MTVATQGWYVADLDGSARGPFDRVDLIDLRARGALADDALVWTLELAEWVPLKRAIPPVPASVTTSARAVPTPQPPVLVLPARQPSPASLMASLRTAPSTVSTNHALPTTTSILTKPKLADTGEKLERLQWGARRLLARLIDFAVFSGIAWALIAIGVQEFRIDILPSFAESLVRYSIVLVIALGLLTIPLEALSLALGGYTPGKFVVGLRVIRRDGGYFHPALAFQRSVKVWLRGIAGWIPPFSIIAMAVGLGNLVNQGRTRWDQDLGLDLSYGPMPGNRWFIGLVSLILAYSALTQDLYRRGLWQLLNG